MNYECIKELYQPKHDETPNRNNETHLIVHTNAEIFWEIECCDKSYKTYSLFPNQMSATASSDTGEECFMLLGARSLLLLVVVVLRMAEEVLLVNSCFLWTTTVLDIPVPW